jgi:plastocyanin
VWQKSHFASSLRENIARIVAPSQDWKLGFYRSHAKHSRDSGGITIAHWVNDDANSRRSIVLKKKREEIMRSFALMGILFFGLLLFNPSILSAYENEAVTNGGTILGVVKFKGTPPPVKKLQITKDEEVCGKTAKTDPSLIVSQAGVSNAVVYIADIQKGKKMDTEKPILDQKGCEYHPHVLAFPAGSTMEVLNPDGILHNIHSYSQKNTPFNFAQPKFKKTIAVKLDKPEIINIKCDVHNWMNGWLFVTDNPYYSITDNTGNFKLPDVPPGTYTVTVWHETLGKLSKTVSVKPKESVTVTFELATK